ncbi:hypothetical protein L0Y69_02895 [bacterium]|nr:hypothetical protein [bacterium]
MHGSQQLSKREFEKGHVAGKLKTGENRLNEREYAIVRGMLNPIFDREHGEKTSIFYSPKGGATKEEIEEMADTLTKYHSEYGISHKQIAHVKDTLLAHVK